MLISGWLTERVNGIALQYFHRSLRADGLPCRTFFLQVLWEGFVAGTLYALIALGFVLIFKASGVFNFAQGIMVVFAALSLVGFYADRYCHRLPVALPCLAIGVMAIAGDRDG